MRTLVFDDTGEIWDAASRSLGEALHASLSGDELLRYVVRNLGFVTATEGDSSVRLRLRPAVVSPIALSALLYWLHDRPIERVMLSFLDGTWSHELVRSCEEAMRRLMERVGFDAADREGDFLNKEQSLDNLPAESPFRAILQAWSDCGGTYDAERIRPVMQKALNGRFVLFEAQPGSAVRLRQGGGEGFRPGWRILAYPHKRLRVEDQPDYAYGKWVAQLYRERLKTRNPVLDNVDAVVTCSAAAAHELPISAPGRPVRSGRQLNHGSGRDGYDPDISLRIKPGQELPEVLQIARWASIQARQHRGLPFGALRSCRIPFPVRIADAVDDAAAGGTLHGKPMESIDVPARVGE